MILALLQFLVDSVWLVAALIMISIGAGFVAIIARFLFDQLRGARDPEAVVLPEDELPHVLLQIPVFNEAEVTEQALRCVAELDWPKDRLHIQLLDDSTDETPVRAEAVAIELRARGVDIHHVRRADRSGFKAGACAEGLKLFDAPYIAMLDADFRPPADWLRRTVPLLVKDDRAGFVQSRCEFSNYRKNWLTRAQGLVQDGHFLVEQRTRALAGWLFQFNGTGGIWRRQTIEAVGGWSDYSLCEDLDLTVRAALGGWHGIFVSEPPIPGQVPEGLRDYRRQQRRWSNGFVQVAQKTVLPLWNAPWSLTRRVAAIVLIVHQIFFPTAAIGLICLLLGVILRGSLTPYLPVLEFIGVETLVVVVGFTLLPYLALKRGALTDYAKTMVSVPPLMIYLAFSNGAKILQTMRGRKSTFKRTPKTEVTAATIQEAE
ncbi:cellulose synthase/poly-beta-1,6-N-acetylglucosamine synthase-like glycosyltransferase [Methylosinus sp. sav-2]|uniref:glycosyltransferase family 2 protein n=1 Tax=Methylosinus sp. sav-2 TaxID=2485168 RepID=UPI000A99EDA2|nr:glycosyltransferase family 2 protein [Methylosinus sp. sav-2]TDX62194.1 cellulose synthase/poly-beta-1,6-N-acetylglucosamine synthase-like glycosyltransferase [Methylosinus sp. sav-2]